MSKDFTTHLLSFEETIFVREHPFDITCVKVKKTINQINAAREVLENLEATLKDQVAALTDRMKKHD